MGSGELTATMVEVHKGLLAQIKVPSRAVFLDTPAGFQLNADDISRRAEEYFRTRIGHPLTTAAFKSAAAASVPEKEAAYRQLSQAGLILIGPGSPTYAVRQWRDSSIPEIIKNRIAAGGCLIAASAAALTVGRFTLPVYEVYKVGIEPYWEQGIDVLGAFGFDCLVIPHWNNAEGGTHDTRFCYMGASRFAALQALLPSDICIIGLDEHTACLLDLEKEEAQVRGLGRTILRRNGQELSFARGENFPLALLQGEAFYSGKTAVTAKASDREHKDRSTQSFWDQVHPIKSAFLNGIEKKEAGIAVNALLELDRMIWQAQQDLENEEFISQAREILREFIVLLGAMLDSPAENSQAAFSSVIDSLLELREEFRRREQWDAADAVRARLEQAGIIIKDTKSGARWHLKN